MRPIVLTIAGSDPSGGAGIQGDLKAIEACGGWAATVITAITSQNTRGVTRCDVVAAEIVAAQLASVLSDLDVRAVKSGMLGDAAIVDAVAAALRGHAARPYVLDPVLAATGGHALLTAAGREALVAQLFPLASLVTPNAHEAALLADLDLVEDPEQAERAGKRLIERGARAVLVKGGHLERDRGTDVLITPTGRRVFRGPQLGQPVTNTHGTGCALASAIATELAHGRPLEQAVERGKAFITEAIRHGVVLGAGRGAVGSSSSAPGARTTVFQGTPRIGRLHVLTDETLQTRFTHRALARLAAEAGADVVQLREKRPRPTAELVRLAREIGGDLAPYGARLIVNDRADVADAAGAAGVHLGRDDLDPAAARRLLGPVPWIGRTVNAPGESRTGGSEVANYLGVGPVFGTSSKAHPAAALGLEGLRAIVRGTDRPVIAIGHVTPDRVEELLEAGAWGVAVLSAVACAPDPALQVHRLAEALERALKSLAR